MKYVSLLIAVLLLVSFGGCTFVSSVPRHSADEVTTIAKSFSPKCQQLLPPPEKHG